MVDKKVKFKDQLGRVVRIPDGNAGATLGKNLYGPDGKLLTAAQIINPTTAPQQNGMATLWKLIREVPENLVAIAALAGVGFPARKSDGSWVQRILRQGTGITLSNGDGAGGDPTIRLTDEAVASLAKADTALQAVVPGTGIAVDSTDPLRPVVSATGTGGGGAGDNPIFPQLTDQLGALLTDQLGQPLRQNAPSVPYTWLSGPGTGYLQRDASGTWALVAEPVKPVYALTALPSVTPFPREIYVTGTSGVSGVIPAYTDGVKWLRFSDNTEVN